VLAGSGFGDDPFFSHPLDQQSLAHDIIGLVRAGMVEVFTLDVDPGAAEVVGQIFGKGERGGTAGIIGHQVDVFLPEGFVPADSQVGLIQLGKGLVEHFRDESPSPVPEIPFFRICLVHGVVLSLR
jgi:hypothetical protein